MNHIMNGILTGVNQVGRMFCDYAGEVFIQSTLLILGLFAFELLLRKRLRAVFRYCVWMLVLIKLVLPPTLSLPTGIGYWVGAHFPVASVPDKAFDMPALEQTESTLEMRQVRASTDDTSSTAGTLPANAVLIPLAWQAVLFVLWLVGLFAFVLVLAQRLKFVRGLVARSRVAPDELLGALEQCRQHMGVRRDIRLRLSEAISSPAVCGLFGPTILMPANLVNRLSPEGLRATLIHEVAHIKRGDLWVNAMQTALQAVYFYNPFVWFANAMIRRVCEEAVDETVVVALGGRAEGYSNTLIDIGEMAFWRTDLGLRLIGVAESRKALQWRIRTMLNRPIPKSSKLGIVGTIVIFAVAAILLPMARAQKVDVGSKPIATENEGKPAKSLHQAAAEGDIEQVKALIAKGADVNKGDRRGNTPLHYAAVSGDKQTIELLLSKGADINAKNRDGRTPLFEAMKSAATGRKEVVELLVSKGAKIPTFHLAAYMGDMEKLKKFLQEGVNINTIADCNITALHAAANSGNKDIVQFLVNKGALVDARDASNLTPLYYAAIHNYEDMADLLLENGADVTARDKNGYSLLYDAIWDHSKDAIKLLISKGANVNVKDDAGYTPLVYAIWENDKDMVELLIGKGADVNAEDNEGLTPYYWAAMEGRKDMVELLTAKGATPVFAIHLAAREGDLGKVKRLIEEGADVNMKDRGAGTPLYAAVLADNNDVAKFLIAKGADVNVKDTAGRTPLEFVILSRGKKNMVELLISGGADVNAKDKWGVTPLHAACVRGQTDVAELLIAKGADLNARITGGEVGFTPLHFGSFYGHKDAVELLIIKGADINITDNNSQTPLHSACLRGHKDVAELLIAKGADVNARNDNGQTALAVATAQGHEDVVELLKKHGAKK